MGSGVDRQYAEIPVDEYGASIIVSRQTLGELLGTQQVATNAAAQERLDFPIHTIPGGYRTSLQSLGNQPSHRVLLDNIKGWSSISGAAVSRRIRGLSKNLRVFSEHMVKGKLEIREQPEHRLAKTLRNPNDVFTMGDMLWLLAWHLQQVGEGYWQKLTDGMGLVNQLWPLPPENVSPVFTDTATLVGWMVRDGKGKEFALEANEICRFWTPDPKTLFSSMGVLGPMATEYDQSRFLEDHLKGHFENDATPRMVIIGKDSHATVQDGVQRDFHRKWRAMHNARVGTARSLPAFIPPGWDIKELNAHGNAADVIPLKEANRRQTMAGYGVPGSVVGMDENVNRATAEALDWIFDKNTITHYTDIISEVLTTRIAEEFDSRLRVGFREFVQPDKEHVLKQEKQDLDKGVRSVQQVITARGGNPKDAPWGEKPILGFSLGPYDGDFSVEDRLEIVGASAVLGSSSVSKSTSNGNKRRNIRTLSMTRDDPMDVDAAQRRAIAHGQQFVKPLVAAVLRVLKSQKIHIAEQLQELTPQELVLSPKLSMEPRNRQLAVVRAISEAALKKLFDPRTWDEVFAAAVADHLAQPFLAAASDATRTVAKEEFIFSIMAQEAVRTQTFKLAGQVNQTTLRKVAHAVQGAVDNAEGAAGIVKRLEQTFGRNRARVIARTEIITAVQEGQVHGWRSTGEVPGKQWHVSGNNTRESHFAADGQEVMLEAMFVLGSGAYANAPGDTRLTAGDRVNCQCFMTPIILQK